MDNPMTMLFELITPDKAAQFMERNGANRALRDRHWQRLATDMGAGRWCVTHEPIAFDDDGNLIDGQHRTKGIIASGTSQWMWVCRGVPRDAMKAANRPRIRNLPDLMHWCKIATEKETSPILSTFRAFPRTSQDRASQLELLEVYKKYGDAISFGVGVMRLLKSCSLTTSSGVACAFARASYHVDEQTLMDILDHIKDGVESGTSSRKNIAQWLRDHLIRTTAKKITGGGRIRLSLYRETSLAIYAFAELKSLSWLKNNLGGVTDWFPLPPD